MVVWQFWQLLSDAMCVAFFPATVPVLITSVLLWHERQVPLTCV
jgi:hypothetical protein